MKKVLTLKTMLRASMTLTCLALSAPVYASPDTEQCDRLAGSIYDETLPAGTMGREQSQIAVTVALPACQAAYDANPADPRIAFQLARVLAQAGDSAAAEPLFDKAAKAGHVAAMVSLGAELQDTDPKAAFSWYAQAAAKDHVVGLFNLGIAYRDGIGVPVDGEKSADWFRKASDKGDGLGAYDLAVLHDEGKILPVNKTEAVRFYRLAAERGIVDAMINLAMILEAGEGVPADTKAAATFFQMAAERGDVDGIEGVKRLKTAE